MNLYKRCVTCGVVKNFDEFHRDKKSAGGYRTQCKDCRNDQQRGETARTYNLRSRYGIEMAEYDGILLAQGGRCAICNKKSEGRSLVVDHNHETGQVRGLLCHHCNTALGLFRDDPINLSRAADYLLIRDAEVA
jgi:hypothetical protein